MTRPYQQSKSESGAEKTELLNTESLDHQSPSDLPAILIVSKLHSRWLKGLKMTLMTACMNGRVVCEVEKMMEKILYKIWIIRKHILSLQRIFDKIAINSE